MTYFETNRRMTPNEAKSWLQKFLGDSLICLISISKKGDWAKATVNTDRGQKEVKISLPVVVA